MASLPVVIFQFALSPYKDWQQLAWTGALIITLAVLALSIIARLLAAQRKTIMSVWQRFTDPDRHPRADQQWTASTRQGFRSGSRFLLRR